MSLPRIVAASETIVHGRVDSVRSYWEGKNIWTEVTLSVVRSLKGSPGAKVTVMQIGGRVESPVPLEMAVPDAPVHRVGDEGFYFLEARGEGRRIIVGLFQGRVLIRRDERGPFVVFGGVRWVVEAFEEEIRRVLAGQGTSRPEIQK